MSNALESSFSTGDLPSYKNPPVNEVVCGLRFDTPAELRIPHIGYLWDKFRTDYPIIQHAPPIASAKGEISIDPAIGMPLPRGGNIGGEISGSGKYRGRVFILHA